MLDKAAIAYFAVVGYTAYTGTDWLMFRFAAAVFAELELLALMVLGDKESMQ